MVVVRGRLSLDIISGRPYGERCIYVDNRNDQVSEMICEPAGGEESIDSFVSAAQDWIGHSRLLTFMMGLFWSL